MYFIICPLRYYHYYYRHSDSIVINTCIGNNTHKAGTDSDYYIVPGSFDHCKRHYTLCYYISWYRILLHFA